MPLWELWDQHYTPSFSEGALAIHASGNRIDFGAYYRTSSSLWSSLIPLGCFQQAPGDHWLEQIRQLFLVVPVFRGEVKYCVGWVEMQAWRHRKEWEKLEQGALACDRAMWNSSSLSELSCEHSASPACMMLLGKRLGTAAPRVQRQDPHGWGEGGQERGRWEHERALKGSRRKHAHRLLDKHNCLNPLTGPKS